MRWPLGTSLRIVLVMVAALVLLVLYPMPSRAAATIERHAVVGKCFAIVRDGVGKPHPIRLPGLQVLLDTRVSPQQSLGLSPPKPPGTKAYFCLRDQLVPKTENSHGDALLVAEAGLPLYIAVPDGRIGALEVGGDPLARAQLTNDEIEGLLPEMKEAPDDADPSAPEKLAVRVAKEPAPSCEPGHGDALVNGAVTIRPGQTLCIRLKVEGDVVRPEAVVSSRDSANTLVLRMRDEPGTGTTFLYLYNPLSRNLLYDAVLSKQGKTQAEHTSTCPVLSSRMGFEYWTYYFVSRLTLTQFKLASDDAKFDCK